jgi:hypothetical protein
MANATPNTIVEGLHERFATITGLHIILDHEPASIHDTPTLYTLTKRYRKIEKAGVVVETFEFTHRLIVDSAENTTAEPLLRALIPEVSYCVERDPQLGNRINKGRAFVEEGIAGYSRINGTTYRVMDFTSFTKSSRVVLRP